MKRLMGYSKLELTRFMSPKKIGLFLLILIVSLYFINDGIGKYEKINEKKEVFQEIEKANVKKFINYSQYGAFGFRLLFIPSPINIIFFNSGVSQELVAFLDSGARIMLYNSLLGENLYSEKSYGFNDFSSFFLLIISILSIIWGYFSLWQPEFMKILANFSSCKKAYFSYMFAKLMVLNLFIIITIACALILMVFKGIHISQEEFLNIIIFLVLIIITSFIFFLLGTIGGSINSRVFGIILVMAIWFVLMILIPRAQIKIISKKADNITSAYKLEQRKLDVLSEFEKIALDEGRRYTSMEERKQSERKLIEGYWNNEFRKIQAIEKGMQKEMRENYHFYKWIAILFPTTFYHFVTGEISSKGYENFFDFYEFAQNHQEKFVRYYLNKKFYSDYSKVESYIKGDKNLFYAHSRVPGNFGWGILLTLFYIWVLVFVSFVRFKKMLYRLPTNWKSGLKNPRLNLKKGELRLFYVQDRRFTYQLYNLFSGKNKLFKQNGFEGKVYIDDKDIVVHPQEEKFLYLSRFDHLPEDTLVGDFLRLIGLIGIDVNPGFAKKHFSMLTREEKEELYLSILKQTRVERDIYLIDDICKGMSIPFILRFKKQMETLSQRGSLVIYLTTDFSPPVISLRKEETFRNHNEWLTMAEKLEGLT